jgi:competence protein ComEA
MKKQLIISSMVALGLLFTAPVMANSEGHHKMTHKEQASAKQTAKVNINSASVEQLATLKRIGAKKAAAIIAYRDANGPFKSIDDLSKVKGISTGIVAANKEQLTL